MTSPPPEPYPVALLECTVDPIYLTEQQANIGDNSNFTITPVVDEWDEEADGIEISHVIYHGQQKFGYIGRDRVTIFYSDDRFYSVVDDLCTEDMTQILPLLREYYPLWRDNVKAWDSKTFIAKFESKDFEQFLVEIEKSWSDCNIYKYQRSGKWIVAVDVVRDYCHKQRTFYGTTANIDPLKFTGFLIQQPFEKAFPFILPYMVSGILLVLSFFVVYKINRIKQVTISILILNLVASPVCLYMVVIAGWSLIISMIRLNIYFYWSVFVIVLLFHLSSLDKSGQQTPPPTN